MLLTLFIFYISFMYLYLYHCYLSFYYSLHEDSVSRLNSTRRQHRQEGRGALLFPCCLRLPPGSSDIWSAMVDEVRTKTKRRKGRETKEEKERGDWE